MGKGPGPGPRTGLKFLQSRSGPTDLGPGLFTGPGPVQGPDPATLIEEARRRRRRLEERERVCSVQTLTGVCLRPVCLRTRTIDSERCVELPHRHP